MSEEIKKTEKPEPAQVVELAEQKLDQVAGGKVYNETRSNSSTYAIPGPITPVPAPLPGRVIKPAG